MLKTNWEKIDKFYIVLAVILTLMAVLVIVTVKSIFSAYNSAYALDEEGIGNEMRIDKSKLEEVYEWSFNKKTLPLEVKD